MGDSFDGGMEDKRMEMGWTMKGAGVRQRLGGVKGSSFKQ
jgi:hypothetical protein